jgi:hypothetical protein
LASFFTQTRGVCAAVAVAVFLLWDGLQTKASWRTQCERPLWLLLSFVLAWGILSSYFIAKVGISKLLYFQTVYVLRYVTGEAHNIWPAEHDPLAWPIRYMLVYFALPIVYAISFWKCTKVSQETASADVRRCVLPALAGLAMFLEAARSPNWLRIDCVAMPGLILFVWLMFGAAEQLRAYARWTAYAATVIWIGLIFQGARQVWVRNVSHVVVMDLPAGTTAAVPVAAEKLAWVAGHTTPGEFFLQSAYQSLYLPCLLRNPAFDSLDRYSSPELVELDIRRLEAKHVRYILWSPLDLPRRPRFEQFLADRYHRVWRFSDQDEIWQLR